MGPGFRFNGLGLIGLRSAVWCLDYDGVSFVL